MKPWEMPQLTQAELAELMSDLDELVKAQRG